MTLRKGEWWLGGRGEAAAVADWRFLKTKETLSATFFCLLSGYFLHCGRYQVAGADSPVNTSKHQQTPGVSPAPSLTIMKVNHAG